MRAFQNPIRVRSRFPLASHHLDPKGPVSSCCTSRSPEPSMRYNRSPSSDEARYENSSGVTRIGMEREAASRIPHAGATWPDTIDDIFGGDCSGTPEVYGASSPLESPAPQPPPGRGTSPRINVARAARKAARLPDVLLGWVAADGFPMIVRVRISETETRGIVLDAPDGIVPVGGRRAGLTAQWFDRAFRRGKPTGWGMSIRVHTGWLEVTSAERGVLYAPHTKAGYSLPASTR